MSSRAIPTIKERDSHHLWMDGDMNDAMRKFAGTQGDGEYLLT